MQMKAFLITLLSGLSFFIGYLITRFVKNEKKLVIFAIGFSFSIILGLCFLDMLPECLEMENKIYMVLSMIGGVAILKILDFFIPDHTHDEKEQHDKHIEHIGLISALALFLHNMIEGTAIYTTSLTNLKLGLFMALGVSFHNIPLGIQTSSLIHKKSSKLELLSILALSSVVGVLIIKVFDVTISEVLSGILMSAAFGMLIYISLFELLCEVKEHFKQRELIYGLIVGVIFVLFGHLLH